MYGGFKPRSSGQWRPFQDNPAGDLVKSSDDHSLSLCEWGPVRASPPWLTDEPWFCLPLSDIASWEGLSLYQTIPCCLPFFPG